MKTVLGISPKRFLFFQSLRFLCFDSIKRTDNVIEMTHTNISRLNPCVDALLLNHTGYGSIHPIPNQQTRHGFSVFHPVRQERVYLQ